MRDQGITDRERYLMEFAYGSALGMPYRANKEVRHMLDDTISDAGHKCWQLLVHQAPKDERDQELAALRERMLCAELRLKELTPKIDEPLQRLGALLADLLDDDAFNNVEQYLNAALVEVVSLRERVRVLESGQQAVISLMDSSDGVSGLHLNGDVATWGELCRGGEYEAWLGAFSDSILAGGGKGEDRGTDETTG